MFETRSDAWEKVGLSFQVNEKEVKRAQRQATFFLLGIIGLYVATRILLDHSHYRNGCTTAPNCGHVSLLSHWGVGGLETLVQIVAALLVLLLGWGLARAIGRFVGPTFLRRMDPATAGTFGFVLRLVTMALAILVALGVAGVDFRALAVGGAFTAVILGLAAQQTLGNVIAGMVLLSARPFRVGQRIRLQAGALGGQLDGTVSSLGLLYTNLIRGAEQVMIPNTQVLAAVVVPLREPDGVDVKVRLSSGIRPSQVQAILDQEVTTPTRSGTTVLLEEVDGDDVVVRVQATPESPDDGAQLADEVMVALSSVTRGHETVETAQR
ncbi:MAG TPA: mechanosensitive ion channel family protein [Solirubrobacteraceae bacterium]|jgi:small-conductance mechanosensitive channel|nr:mechanosensitive ion channel family protein [Solirubrobacteraceae bacterium]